MGGNRISRQKDSLLLLLSTRKAAADNKDGDMGNGVRVIDRIEKMMTILLLRRKKARTIFVELCLYLSIRVNADLIIVTGG